MSANPCQTPMAGRKVTDFCDCGHLLLVHDVERRCVLCPLAHPSDTPMERKQA